MPARDWLPQCYPVSVQCQRDITLILVKVPMLGFDEGHVYNYLKGKKGSFTDILVR